MRSLELATLRVASGAASAQKEIICVCRDVWDAGGHLDFLSKFSRFGKSSVESLQ
jgi:hypothetical protein